MSIAKYFGVSLDFLVGLIDEPHPLQRDSAYVIHISRETPDAVVDIITSLAEVVNKKFRGDAVGSL